MDYGDHGTRPFLPLKVNRDLCPGPSIGIHEGSQKVRLTALLVLKRGQLENLNP